MARRRSSSPVLWRAARPPSPRGASRSSAPDDREGRDQGARDLSAVDLEPVSVALRARANGNGDPSPGSVTTARALARAHDARAVVLVEGVSDQLAVETLAARRGWDLAAEGVVVVPTGGVHAIGRFLDRLGPRGAGVQLAGLCDAGEVEVVRRAVEIAGLGRGLSRSGLERLGFFVCDADLEAELVRSLGPAPVEEVIEAQGELRAFRTFQKQVVKRELGREEQLWRFMWNRKIRYAPLLVEALDLERIPRALDGVLAYVA